MRNAPTKHSAGLNSITYRIGKLDGRACSLATASGKQSLLCWRRRHCIGPKPDLPVLQSGSGCRRCRRGYAALRGKKSKQKMAHPGMRCPSISKSTPEAAGTHTIPTPPHKLFASVACLRTAVGDASHGMRTHDFPLTKRGHHRLSQRSCCERCAVSESAALFEHGLKFAAFKIVSYQDAMLQMLLGPVDWIFKSCHAVPAIRIGQPNRTAQSD